MNQETSADLSADRTALVRGGGGTYSSSGANQMETAAQHDSDGTHPHSILCIPMVATIWAKVLWGFGTAKLWTSILCLTMISMIGKVSTLLIQMAAPVFCCFISISHLVTALMLHMTSRVIISMARRSLWSMKRLAAATLRLLLRIMLIILAEVMSFAANLSVKAIKWMMKLLVKLAVHLILKAIKTVIRYGTPALICLVMKTFRLVLTVCSSVAKRLNIFQRQPFDDEKSIISEQYSNRRDTTAEADEYLNHSEDEENLHNMKTGHMAAGKYTESSQEQETSSSSFIEKQELYEPGEPWLETNCSSDYLENFDESGTAEMRSFSQLLDQCRLNGRYYREAPGCNEENYFSDSEYSEDEDEDEPRIGTLHKLPKSLHMTGVLGLSQYMSRIQDSIIVRRGP